MKPETKVTNMAAKNNKKRNDNSRTERLTTATNDLQIDAFKKTVAPYSSHTFANKSSGKTGLTQSYNEACSDGGRPSPGNDISCIAGQSRSVSSVRQHNATESRLPALNRNERKSANIQPRRGSKHGPDHNQNRFSSSHTTARPIRNLPRNGSLAVQPQVKSIDIKKPSNSSMALTSRDSPIRTRALMPRHDYTIKPVIPARTAELLDVARAMHRDQFASRVKKLFDPEREAALQAIHTSIYVGWRCLGNNFDCIRVGDNSKCFCGHQLNEHAKFTASRKQTLECLAQSCSCKQFAFIPSRPEEIGEWWLQKRPGFDLSSWRAKCRCKHTHEEHNPNSNRKCRIKSCTCFAFDSNFLCAACDKHWEEHETVFDDLNSRQQKGLPYGEEYLPFHELPQLRNIVLTGNEDDDIPYNDLVTGPYAIPRSQPTQLSLRLQGKKF